MDFLHGVGNFLWTTTAAAGNLGYSTSKAISEQIFGRSGSGSNTTNISSNGWINSLWYGSNSSSVTSDPRGCGSNPQFDVRRKDIVMMWSRVGSNFVRVAGLSGALAVSMGAYGAHGKWQALSFNLLIYVSLSVLLSFFYLFCMLQLSADF